MSSLALVSLSVGSWAHGLVGSVFIWFIAAWWGLYVLFAVLNALLLPRLSAKQPRGVLPRLSVIIPARNEEVGIERAVEAHCTQDYPWLEVVVVDDGSTDATPQILARLQQSFANLIVLQGEPPKKGWLGKPHAQMQGVKAATGVLILFVDADVVYSPGVYRRAVGEMMERELDMLLLLSTLEGRGLEPLALSFLDTFSFYISPTFLANVPFFRWVAFGAGSGNLVRRDAFDAAGGMERIRSEVVDDVAMGRMMKALRGRFRVVFSHGEIRVRMYQGFRACIEGFTKNCFAAFGFRWWYALPSMLAYVILHLAPPLALATALLAPGLRELLLPAAFATAAEVLLNLWACWWSRQALWVALLAPLRALVWFYILCRSMGRYYRKGVVWRGRTYGKTP